MKHRLLLTIFLSITVLHINAQIWPSSLAGRWTFDNPLALLEATLGNDLTITGSHTAVNGPTVGDGAVAIGIGSYYTCNHGIAPNGGGSYVNEYSMLFDVRIDNPTLFYSLFQTSTGNSNDGDGFINTNSQIGITATGYSGFSLKAKQWYRIVMTVDNGSSFRYYVNGNQVLEGTSQAVDGVYGIENVFHFFADENGEDNLIYCAQLAIFSTCLSSSEVKGLGGFRTSDIKPYLQSPTPTSMFISWNSFNNSSTIVQYGTSIALIFSTTGSYEDVSSYRWHTAQLTGLSADTRYYYRCISGDDTSNIFAFRTPATPGASGKHIRFVKIGDTQANENGITGLIADTIAYVLKQLYGTDWFDSVSFVMHSGDLNQDGSVAGRYMNEFFNPYSALSANIPIMISIGNHEGESGYYYQFVKYSGLTGYNEKYYSFNLGNCQFISLNTSGLYNFSTQTSWLQSQLISSSMDANTDFVFTFNHQPGQSEIWPDGNTSYVQNNIYPILKSYPKMVMTTFGHSHNYERGTLISTHNNNWDFRTVLCGGAGGALDRWGEYANQNDYPEIQKSIDNYSFLLVDVDVDAKKVNARAYSLGNADRPRNLEIIDKWHRYLNQAAPAKPHALSPDSVSSETPVLTATPFSGVDSLMSSEFQLVSIGGNFGSPLIDVVRDVENYYSDTGTPNYIPTNLNTGIDLKRYTVGSGVLQLGQAYMWRMRYRDQNVRWSDWSDTLQFTVVSNPANEADFIADVTSGYAPLTVHFTDFSVFNPVSWQWDLNGDAITDDNTQDPMYTYTTPGIYSVSLTTLVNSQLLTITKQYYINVSTSEITEIDQNDLITAKPNPFNDLVEFRFPAPGGKYSIKLTNIIGKHVRNLYDGDYKLGDECIVWDGKDDYGNSVAAGIYICRFECGTYNRAVKIVRE